MSPRKKQEPAQAHPPQLPWMPITIDKFIGGTTSMGAAEIGAYLLLLMHQWRAGFVPKNAKELENISKLKYSKLSVVLSKFKTDADGTLYNEQCRQVRNEQMGSYLAKVERINTINARKAEQKAQAEANDKAHDIVPDNVNETPVQNNTITRTTSLAISHTEIRNKKEDISTKVETTTTGDDADAEFLKAHETFAQKLLGEGEQLQREQIEVQVREPITAELLQRFNAHLFTGGGRHVHFSQYCAHLRSWMPKRPPMQAVQQTTTKFTNQQPGTTVRRPNFAN